MKQSLHLRRTRPIILNVHEGVIATLCGVSRGTLRKTGTLLVEIEAIFVIVDRKSGSSILRLGLG